MQSSAQVVESNGSAPDPLSIVDIVDIVEDTSTLVNVRTRCLASTMTNPTILAFLMNSLTEITGLNTSEATFHQRLHHGSRLRGVLTTREENSGSRLRSQPFEAKEQKHVTSY